MASRKGQDEEILMSIGDEAGFPREIILFLITNHVLANMNDIHVIAVGDISDLRREYERTFEDDLE